MDRALALLLAALAVLLPGGAAIAQTGAQAGARVVMTASWTEEWDPAAQAWVRIDDSAAAVVPMRYETATTTTTQVGSVTITETVRAEPARFIARPLQATAGRGVALAQYGPFQVMDDTRAALVATTDSASPQAFAAMLAAYPGLRVIEFVDAPGTSNDLANLTLGRKIRAAGLATHVPPGGSARSGAVELFLAGTRRTIAPGALFAVHSWRDERGREPADFAPDAAENRLYLDYYTEMGMSAADARAFYAMTNSVAHASALWLEGADMARWIAPATSAIGQPDPHAPAMRGLAAASQAPRRLALVSPAHWVRHSAARSPQIAYADLGSVSLALLDSRAAFP